MTTPANNNPLLTTSQPDELVILSRGRINAAIIAPIFDEMRAEIGDDRG